MEKENRQPKNTMVCVTEQKTCERLIRAGAALAGDESLSVVHVVKSGKTVLGTGNDGNALEYLFRISRSFGAEMDMLRSDDVIGTIADFALRNQIAYLVIGAPEGRNVLRVKETLQDRLPGVEIVVA